MKIILLITLLAIWTLPSKGNAIDPVTTVLGMVGSPIVCKIIECEKIVHKVVNINNQVQNENRLIEMRNEFEWDESFINTDEKELSVREYVGND